MHLTRHQAAAPLATGNGKVLASCKLQVASPSRSSQSRALTGAVVGRRPQSPALALVGIVCSAVAWLPQPQRPFPPVAPRPLPVCSSAQKLFRICLARERVTDSHSLGRQAVRTKQGRSSARAGTLTTAAEPIVHRVVVQPTERSQI